MISPLDRSAPPPARPTGEGHAGLLRWLALGCVYGVAVAFAIAGSPTVGLIALDSQQAAHRPAAPQHTAFLTPWNGSGLAR